MNSLKDMFNLKDEDNGLEFNMSHSILFSFKSIVNDRAANSFVWWTETDVTNDPSWREMTEEFIYVR